MKSPMICSSCGNVSWGKTAVKGNAALEIILWLFFIIPGVIYSLWRSSSRFKVCPICSSTNLVPLNSPNGKRLLEQQGKSLAEAEAEAAKNPPMGLAKKALIGVGGLIGLVLVIFVIGFFM